MGTVPVLPSVLPPLHVPVHLLSDVLMCGFQVGQCVEYRNTFRVTDMQIVVDLRGGTKGLLIDADITNAHLKC